MSNNFYSACRRAWPKWNNIVTAEVKHSYMKKIKSWDQSLFKRHEFPQFTNVYTATNFYKLLQLQSMFWPQWSNTNFCQKRAHFHQLHGNEQHIWLKCPAKACSYCTATLEIKTKFCIEDSSCHRTSLWRKSVYCTFSGPQTSTYRELNHETEPTKQELEVKILSMTRFGM